MKGFANYLCEEIRRVERNIAHDIEKKERRELQGFVEHMRREIAETEEWLRQEEEAERHEAETARRLEPSAMFYLLKEFGGITAFECFDFRTELEEIAMTMGLTVAQTATYILVAGLQRRCPCGVGPAHLARYTGEERAASAWQKILSDLYRLGLLSIVKRTDKGITYYKLNVQ
ncbi:hypothetical protein [uncultured Alistipes sp.]|uniref:hypothetical protein n=1 Tax=uncultured Alistipes sp. TaxID=538949 RepID=UPI00262CEE10|nr:hypothetical protein [uncultured Alistipes sp.]